MNIRVYSSCNHNSVTEVGTNIMFQFYFSVCLHFFPLYPRKALYREKITSSAYHLTEKSGCGVESMMVSDLPVYRRIATSVTVRILKRGEFV